MATRAIRATTTGLAELEAYINGDDKVRMTEDELNVLTMVPTPGVWVPINTVRDRLKEAEMLPKDLVITVRRLNEAHRLDVFNEITDATNLFCYIGRYRFQQQWTVFRKQIAAANEEQLQRTLKVIADNLYEKGEAIINDGDVVMKVTLL